MMRSLTFKLALVFILLSSFSFAQGTMSVISWNLKDFGKSKSDAEVTYIAALVTSYDVLAIQEVVAGFGGPQAVARLINKLNRKGSKWDFLVSSSTSGTSAHKAERYAFIYKTAKLKLVGKPWLEQKYSQWIEREPFFAKFISEGKMFTLVNYHAITRSQQPAREIKYFKLFPVAYPNDNLIFCGDFNVPQSHSVFNPLRSMGYAPVLKGQKTSLRQKCIDGDCLASEFDNFYFNIQKFKIRSAGVLHFYRHFPEFRLARKLSDHLPVFVTFEL